MMKTNCRTCAIITAWFTFIKCIRCSSIIKYKKFVSILCPIFIFIYIYNITKNNKKNIDNLREIRSDYLNLINIYNKLKLDDLYTYCEENPFLIINHYKLKNKNEYINKINDNPNRKDRYNLKKFNKLDHFLNELEDKTILEKCWNIISIPNI